MRYILFVHHHPTPVKDKESECFNLQLNLLWKRNSKVIRLDPWAENESAIQLYTKMGIEIAGYADFNLAVLI
ncbi:MAG: hypothetical protein ACI37T_07430 [Candidatus Gastranaerophilaceae bacterium]